MPETKSPYAALAYGRGNAQPAEHFSDVDAIEAAPVAAKVSAQKAEPRERVRTAAVRQTKPAPAQTSAPAQAPPATAPQAQPEPELLALNTPLPVEQPMTQDARRYADREAKSQQQRDFRGGDAIVISASALVIILLVILIIILLT